jgi:hypothetical protein
VTKLVGDGHAVRYDEKAVRAIAPAGNHLGPGSSPAWPPDRGGIGEFLNENDALRRADEILRAGVHHGVSVIDGADNVLSGILLE